jgi:hypothetical protein
MFSTVSAKRDCHRLLIEPTPLFKVPLTTIYFCGLPMRIGKRMRTMPSGS